MSAFLTPRAWLAFAFAALLVIIAAQQMRLSHAVSVSVGLRAAIAQTQAGYAQAARTAQAQADRENAERLTQQLKATNAAKTRETSLRADAATANNALDRLRLAIRSATRSDLLPGVPASPPNVDSPTVGALFAECASEVRELAVAADGHASDTKTLIESWPK